MIPVDYSAAACYDEALWVIDNLMEAGTDACVMYMSYGEEEEYSDCTAYQKAGGGDMRKDFLQNLLDEDYGGELPPEYKTLYYLEELETLFDEYSGFETWAWVDGEEVLTAPTKNYDLEQLRAELEGGAEEDESEAAFWLAAGGSAAILTAALYTI